MKTSVLLKFAFPVFAAGALLVGPSAQAANGTWNTGDGNWSDNASWTPGPYVTASDTATFAGSSNYTVYLNGNQAANQLIFSNTGATTLLGGPLGGPAASNTLTISGASAALTVNSGAGVVTIGNTSGAGADLVFSTSSTPITNNGTLIFNNRISLNDVTATKTITLAGTGSTTFNGVIANNIAGGVNSPVLALIITNNGTTTFNNSNTFSGNVTYSTGGSTIVVGANNALGSGLITDAATSNNFIQSSGNYSIQNAITITNSFLNFNGNNSLTVTGALTNSGGSRTLTNNIASNGALTLGNVYLSENATTGRTLTVAGTGNTYIGGTIANLNGSGVAGSLVINSTGLTTLAGNNTFNGTLTMGAGSSVFLAGSNTFTGNTTVTNGSLLKLGDANSMQNATSLDISSGGSATLWLASNSSINNLKINAKTPTALSFARVIVDRASAGSSVNQTMDFTTGVGLGQQTDWTFQKGSLVTSGTPTVTLTGTTVFGNSGSGKTSILNPLGVNLSVGNVTASGGATATVTSTLALEGNSAGNTLSGVISNGSNNGTVSPLSIVSAVGNTLTMSATIGSNYTVGALVSGAGISAGTYITGITGANMTLSKTPTTPSGNLTASNTNVVALIKAGTSTWSLSGANTYGGVTTVQGGTLNLDFSAAGAPSSNILYNTHTFTPTVSVSGGNLQLTGKGSGGNNVQTVTTLQTIGSNSGRITLGGGVSGSTLTLQVTKLTYNTNSWLDFSGLDANNIVNISGATANANQSRATVNSYTDFARVDASKNIIAMGSNNNGALPTSVGNTNNYYTLTGSAALTGNTTFKGIRASAASGTLDLGGFVFQGANTSQSAFLYNGGGTYNITNGTLTSGGSGATEFNFVTSSGSTIAISSSAAINDNPGAASVFTAGLGTVTVSGSKNYTGATRLLGGTYSIDSIANGGSASGLGASGNAAANLILNGSTLRYTGSGGSTDRGFTIGANGATIDSSGSGAVTWAPGVALVYTANQNNYLTLTGNNTGANTFGGGTGVIADATNGYTALTKSGTGTWVLAGANTYTGGTYINDGTLGVTGTETAGTSGPLGKSGPIIFGGGALQFSATNTSDYSKRIVLSTSAINIDTNGRSVTFASALDSSNTGGLTKSGTGNLTLSAANTYTGATTVSAGTLLINGSTSSGSSVTVNNGGTLGGSGTVNGAVTVNSGGTLSPGNSPGLPTYTSGLTLNTGSSFTFELIADTTSGRGTNFDGVNVTGGVFNLQSGVNFNLTLNGAGSTTDYTSAFWDSSQSWLVFQNTNAPSISSLFTLGTVSNDSGGNSFSVTGGSFGFSQVGNDVYLNYTAIPEPSTWALVAFSLTSVMVLRRRRN